MDTKLVSCSFAHLQHKKKFSLMFFMALQTSKKKKTLNKLISVFHASVLLLIMNFVITLST